MDDTRRKYDQDLIRWVKHHYWDSLEKDKALILRHLRTFTGDAEGTDQLHNSGPGGVETLTQKQVVDGLKEFARHNKAVAEGADQLHCHRTDPDNPSFLGGKGEK